MNDREKMLRGIADQHAQAERLGSAVASRAHTARGVLLAEVTEADAVLDGYGVPNDGRRLPERIHELMKPLDPGALDADVARAVAALAKGAADEAAVRAVLVPYVWEILDLRGALEDARETNKKLLDPEFKFGADSMDVIDTRGLVAMMMQAFDKSVREGSVENFMSFSFTRPDRTPAYVVTVQRATKKTPIERYNEVARELAELKGTQFVPLEPEAEEPRAPQPSDHIVVNTKEECFRCDHCGKKQGFSQPIAGNDLMALGKSFSARHMLCPAPKAPVGGDAP